METERTDKLGTSGQRQSLLQQVPKTGPAESREGTPSAAYHSFERSDPYPTEVLQGTRVKLGSEHRVSNDTPPGGDRLKDLAQGPNSASFPVLRLEPPAL